MTKILKTENHVYVLAFFWLTVNLFLFFYTGIETGFESVKYINEANSLVNTGAYSSGNFLFYSVEILLIALSIKLQSGFWLVIACHLILNAVAVLCFYRLIKMFSGSAITALLFTLALVTMPYFQFYNFTLFTESVYFSLTIIFLWVLFSKRTTGKGRIFLIPVLLILLVFTRPMGLFFIPATAIYFIVRSARQVALRLTIAWFGFAGFYFLLDYAMGSGGEFNFLLPYAEEHIICGLPTKQQNEILADSSGSIKTIFGLLSDYPGLVFSLALKRLTVFFTGARSYYSNWHNLFLVTWLCVMYGFMIFNFRRKLFQFKAEMIFLTCLLAFTLITVALTCDDWHNRFLFSVLPVLLLMGVPAAKQRSADDLIL